ncbi:MAG TPA: anaerobic glycerol-3-phosphate dehydrogenase subunit GlpB [Syntrophorhabdales bacterium]|nr:anaerobic glycerol-3-phosphate dehydrogenase subunit GlpB [Syntrophorhabdales bacterium]
MSDNNYQLIVVGMGLSGLMAAMTAAQAGKRVLIIGKGMGSLCLFSNSIDLLCSLKGEDVYEGIRVWVSDHPNHPYAKAGADRIVEALSAFCSLFPLPYTFAAVGSGSCKVPTGAGTYRPTYLLPSTMTSGVGITKGGVIVGVEHFRDFSALQAAKGLKVRGAVVSLGAHIAQDLTPLALARLVEQPTFRAAFAKEVRKQISGEDRVGLPALLGLRNPGRVKEEMENVIGAEVFEMPLLPPSVPGIRIFNRFKACLDQQRNVTFLLGPSVETAIVEGHRCAGIRVVNAPVSALYTADSYVLATGRFLSGGLVASRESIREPVFDFPVAQPQGRDDWFSPSFFEDSHLLNEAGIRVDSHFRPVDAEGRVILENVRIAGSILAYHNSIEEGSREGISLSTGYAASREAVES